MKHRIITWTCLFLATSAGATTAYSQQAPAPSPPPVPAPLVPAPPVPAPQAVRIDAPFVHDGFFLRMRLGFGWSGINDAQDNVTLSGSGGTFSLKLGGAVAPNVIVYGDIFDDISIGPKLSAPGLMGTTNDNVSAGVVGIGPGVTYYFAHNIFIGGTVTATKIQIHDSNSGSSFTGSTDWGWGLSAEVGKEWWVSDNWGLGLVGQAVYASAKDQNNGPTWTSTGFMLGLSATYN